MNSSTPALQRQTEGTHEGEVSEMFGGWREEGRLIITAKERKMKRNDETRELLLSRRRLVLEYFLQMINPHSLLC